MANLTINRGEKLILDNDQATPNSYLTQPNDTNIAFQKFLADTNLAAAKIQEAQLYGTATNSDRAVVGRIGGTTTIGNGQCAVAIPMDLTSAAIQKAIDNLPTIGGMVFLPTGTYSVTNTITLRSNVIVQGCGWANTILQGSSGGLTNKALLATTISGGTTYSGIFLRDFAVDNIASSNTGSIGIDFHQVNAGGIEAVQVQNVETAIRLQGQAYYNSFNNLIISNSLTGMNFNEYTYPTGPTPPAVYNYPNSNRTWGVRINDTDVGFDVDGDQNSFYSCSVEQGDIRIFTRGFRLKNSSGVRGTLIVAPRLENRPGSGAAYGIEIGVAAADTTIIAPYYYNINGDNLHDASSGTTISMDVYGGLFLNGTGGGGKLTVGGNKTTDSGYGFIDSVQLARYTEGHFTGTLNGGVTGTPTATFYYTIVGKVVTLYVSGLTAASTSTAQPYVTGLPTNLYPARTQDSIGRVMNNSTVAAGIIQIATSGNINLFTDIAGTSTFSAGGNKGLQDFVGSYLLS